MRVKHNTGLAYQPVSWHVFRFGLPCDVISYFQQAPTDPSTLIQQGRSFGNFESRGPIWDWIHTMEVVCLLSTIKQVLTLQLVERRSLQISYQTKDFSGEQNHVAYMSLRCVLLADGIGEWIFPTRTINAGAIDSINAYFTASILILAPTDTMSFSAADDYFSMMRGR